MYAIALFALVGIVGIGFDYGRLMALDTELQNAADQAALAAATQLDGRSDAMARARAAANDYFASTTSAFTNETRFANERGVAQATRRRITSLSFNFYTGYASDAPTGAAITDDTASPTAKVVEVVVNTRTANFALTPVVGAIAGATAGARAMATLDQAVCKVPPLMVCVNDNDFPRPSDEGKGIVMRSLPNNNVDALAPGNFGFLDLYGTHGGTGNPNNELGQNSDYNGCGGSNNITTEPGFRASATNAMNTRFDLYPNNLNCNTTTGDFCPAQGVRKNFTLTETSVVSTAIPPIGAPNPPPVVACGAAGATRSTTWTDNAAAGNFPRDDCFISGTCTYIGNQGISGYWQINDYMTQHHPGVDPNSLPKQTRYGVYRWEIDNARNVPEKISTTATYVDSNNCNGNGGGNGNGAPPPNQRCWTVVNTCAFPNPIFGTPLVPSTTQKDRRVLTVAAVDCTGINGREGVDPIKWIDLFLVSPATKDNSTDQLGEIFAEVIGPAKRPGGGSGFQYYGRRKAVLIR